MQGMHQRALCESPHLHHCIIPLVYTSSVTRHSRCRRPCSTASAVGSTQPVETVDVGVIGSGIIGLCIARRLLQNTPLSVALLDAQQPCAGATGAGQGYIWLAHRDPASPTWLLARRSKAMWEQLAAEQSSAELGQALEWQANGSLLLATTQQEVEQLRARSHMLQQQGIPGVVLLSPRELKMREPALSLPTGSHGLLVRSDAQMNGKRTAFAMLQDCQRRGGGPASASAAKARLLLGLHEPVLALEPRGSTGNEVDIITQKRRVRAKHGVVVAAGVWSGQLLADATGQQAWRHLLQPRRGHLLEMQPPQGMPPIHTGMMELSYTQHYSTTATATHSDTGHPLTAGSSSREGVGVDITFTATSSASGTLLIGSSREFSGWESTPSTDIITAIMARATQFLPQLASITPEQLLDTTRVGLRPYAVGGLPAIGPVPGLPGVFVAAGHEGSGLCLGPASAELVLHNMLGLVFDANGQSTTPEDVLTAAEELLPERRLKGAAALV